MPELLNVSPPGVCRDLIGSITTSAGFQPFDPLTEQSRANWAAADFSRIAVGYARGAETFVERLSLVRGETVLDVACGTGNLTLPAAHRGAAVTGIDIAPNLIESARAASRAESLEISFDVGNAEALPYDDGRFQTVISMFGVMFSARPERALAELLRVTQPGGRIAMANWAPGGFIGAMLRAHAAFVPPPAGASSPLAWGDETTMRQRLATHSSKIAAVRFVPRTIVLTYPLTPGGVVELFREFYGPSVRAFAKLDAAGRAALGAELLRLWSERRGERDGVTSVEAEYVEIQIDRA